MRILTEREAHLKAVKFFANYHLHDELKNEVRSHPRMSLWEARNHYRQKFEDAYHDLRYKKLREPDKNKLILLFEPIQVNIDAYFEKGVLVGELRTDIWFFNPSHPVFQKELRYYQGVLKTEN